MVPEKSVKQQLKTSLSTLISKWCSSIEHVSKAEAIAKPLGFNVANIEDLKSELTDTDILIVATGASEYTVDSEHFEALKKEMLLIDLSVPRNINPEVRELNGLELIDMDQLNSIQDETLAMRRKNIPKSTDHHQPS